MEGLSGNIGGGLNVGANMSGENKRLDTFVDVNKSQLKFLGSVGPFVCTDPGRYLVAHLSAGGDSGYNGGSGNPSGAGGALKGRFFQLRKGDQITWNNSSLTFPDGSVMNGPTNSPAFYAAGEASANFPSNGRKLGGSYGPFVPSTTGPGNGADGELTSSQQGYSGGPCLVTILKSDN